jgi:hypothetical protein
MNTQHRVSASTPETTDLIERAVCPFFVFGARPVGACYTGVPPWLI